MNEIVNAAIPKDVDYKSYVNVAAKSYVEVLERSDEMYDTRRCHTN